MNACKTWLKLLGITIDINTSGLPACNIFTWILRYQFKITKADEYWRKMTNMRVIEHRWLLNNTKKYWSAVNFISKHSHISAIFDNAFQSGAGSPDVYMSMGVTLQNEPSCRDLHVNVCYFELVVFTLWEHADPMTTPRNNTCLWHTYYVSIQIWNWSMGFDTWKEVFGPSDKFLGRAHRYGYKKCLDDWC